MAFPILSKDKVKLSKIATVLGPTMVSLSPFHFLSLLTGWVLQLDWNYSSGPVLEATVSKFT